MELLIPHLLRAATINRILDLPAIAETTFEAAIDTFSVPVPLTDDLMRIVHANPAVWPMLDRGGLICDVTGVLVTTNRPVTRALELPVDRASSDISALGRKGLGIPARTDSGESAALHVLPLHDGAALAQCAVVAIFVADIGTAFHRADRRDWCIVRPDARGIAHLLRSGRWPDRGRGRRRAELQQGTVAGGTDRGLSKVRLPTPSG